MSSYTRRSADQWQALVNEQQQSILSAPQFCKQYNIGYASFCQWRKRLVDTPTDSTQQLPKFVEIDPPEVGKPNWVVELQLSADIVLRVGRI